MKFTQESTSANVVHSFEPGAIRVRERVVREHLIVTADAIIAPWLISEPPRIQLADLEPVLALRPDVIIVGTGLTLQFPDPSLAETLAAQGIGFEVMDTAAACRTYNVLVHEDRAVAAALLNEGPSPPG